MSKISISILLYRCFINVLSRAAKLTNNSKDNRIYNFFYPSFLVVYKHISPGNPRNIPLLILLIRLFQHFVLPVPIFETFALVVGHFLFRHLTLFVSRHETVGFSV